MKMKIKSIMRLCIVAAVCLFAHAGFANPSITLNGAWRHEPWDGQIDISYTIREVETNVYTVVIQSVDANGNKTRLKQFTNPEGVTTTNGTWFVTWDAATDCGPDFDYKNIQLTGYLVCGAKWLVVDVSGGANATEYKYEYYNGLEDPATFFNTDEFKTTKIPFVRCEPGTFMMGKPGVTTPGDFTYHQVTLTKEFYIAIFPTTVAQFTNITTKVITQKGEVSVGSNMGGGEASWPFAGPLGPMFGVGMLTVGRTCDIIEQRSGVRFQLATDAQWEYACRAGTTSDFYTGGTFAETQAAYDEQDTFAWSADNATSPTAYLGGGQTGGGQPGGGQTGGKGGNKSGYPQPVGCKLPNAWGIYDMQGNCTEWVRDRYVTHSTTNTVDPDYTLTDADMNSGAGTPMRSTSFKHTVKGFGTTSLSAVNGPWPATSWYRMSHGSDCTATYHGFRLSYPFPDSDLGLSESMKPGSTHAQSDPIGITEYKAEFPPPEVKLIRVRQRYPWNELVDVDYRVKGFAVSRRLRMSVKDNSDGGRRYAATTFLTDPMSDVETYLTPGDHRITWCSTNDGCVVFSRNNTTRLSTFPGGDASWETPVEALPQFLIVDLATGAVTEETQPSPVMAYNREEFKTTKLVLRKLSAGTFPMGSPDLDLLRNESSEVFHPVKFSHPYYLGLFEVTQAQYQNLMGTNPSSSAMGGAYPVENITHAQAVAFMNALSAKTGRNFSLPTEAQWECAARAGMSYPYANGTMVGSNFGVFAWYGANSSGGIHHVGTRTASSWAFWDMFGNVAEWCADSYTEDLSRSLIDPKVTTGTGNVVRGGSYGADLPLCRSAARGIGTTASGHIGMRVALTTQE